MRKLKTILSYVLLGALCLAALATLPGAAQNGTAASAVPEAAAARGGNIGVPKAVLDKMIHSTAEVDPNPLVGIGQGDFIEATRAAVENAGGLAGTIKSGDVVLIKPNLCTYPKAGSPTTTDYRVVQAVVDMVRQMAPSRIIVAEGGFTGNAFSPANMAMTKYDTIKGVEFVDFNSFEKKDCYELKPPNSLIGRTLFIPKVYMDAAVVIDVAKLKTHFQPDAVVSLSLKNAFGVPSEKIYGGYGYKGGLHVFPLKEAIVELNMIRKPDFSVIDGIIGGEGYGPASNMPVKSNVVFAGRDPVALDTVALTFMGFGVDQIPHVALAAKSGLGIADLSKIKVVGADVQAIKMDFQSSFKRNK
jgi:uncharacterized protein (DUF362 family)